MSGRVLAALVPTPRSAQNLPTGSGTFTARDTTSGAGGPAVRVAGPRRGTHTRNDVNKETSESERQTTATTHHSPHHAPQRRTDRDADDVYTGSPPAVEPTVTRERDVRCVCLSVPCTDTPPHCARHRVPATEVQHGAAERGWGSAPLARVLRAPAIFGSTCHGPVMLMHAADERRDAHDASRRASGAARRRPRNRQPRNRY